MFLRTLLTTEQVSAELDGGDCTTRQGKEVRAVAEATLPYCVVVNERYQL